MRVEENWIAGTHTLSHTPFNGAIRWKENERITLTHIRIQKHCKIHTEHRQRFFLDTMTLCLSLSLVCVSHRYVACHRKMRVRANTFAFNSAERWCYYVLPLLLLLHSFCSTIRFIVNSRDRVLCVRELCKHVCVLADFAERKFIILCCVVVRPLCVRLTIIWGTVAVWNGRVFSAPRKLVFVLSKK